MAYALAKCYLENVELRKRVAGNVRVEPEHIKQVWAAAQAIELPHEETQSIYVTNTLTAACSLTGHDDLSSFRLSRLLNPENFETSAQWALYWLLTNATRDSAKRALDGVKEDALSTTFRQGLIDAARLWSAAGGPEAALEVSSACFYEHTSRSMDETRTGADMVLVIAGDGLTAPGAAILVWIQAKRFDGKGKNPYLMNYWQKPESATKTQCETFKERHCPALGSYAFYAHFAEALPDVAGVLADAKLNGKGTTLDLHEKGTRLQELILHEVATARAARSAPARGMFQTPDEAAAYLQTVQAGRELPLTVVTVSTKGESFGSRLRAKLKALKSQAASAPPGTKP